MATKKKLDQNKSGNQIDPKQKNSGGVSRSRSVSRREPSREPEQK